MRKLSTFCFLVTALAANASAAVAVDQDDVKAVARAFDNAQLTHDRAVLERTLADDLVFVRGSGKRTGREEFLETFSNAALKMEPFTIVDPIFVQLGPNAAILGGETTMRGTENGEAFADHFRYADTYMKRDGRWQVVHIQVTPIK